MATLDGYPYVSSFVDRHGKQRWRYRKAGKTIALPGEPGDDAFEAAYAAAIGNRPKTSDAKIIHLKSNAIPRTFGDAWRILTTRTPDWKKLDPATRYQQTRASERFMAMEVVEGEKLTFRDIRLDEVGRKHVKAILTRFSDHPHAGGKVLRIIRKLVTVALDEEWIDSDPTTSIKYKLEYEGWRAWTDDERAAYEARWDIGSTPRLVYALGLYTGQRRSDLCRMRWSDISDTEIHIIQDKTGKELWLPIHPALAECLAAAPRKGEMVLVTQYDRPFSDKALGMRMMGWTEAAGIEKGATIHGLRKTLGKLLAESGATTRELMDILGHDAIAHAELYSREAEQRHLARTGFAKLQGNHLSVIKGGKN